MYPQPRGARVKRADVHQSQKSKSGVKRPRQRASMFLLASLHKIILLDCTTSAVVGGWWCMKNNNHHTKFVEKRHSAIGPSNMDPKSMDSCLKTRRLYRSKLGTIVISNFSVPFLP